MTDNLNLPLQWLKENQFTQGASFGPLHFSIEKDDDRSYILWFAFADERPGTGPDWKELAYFSSPSEIKKHVDKLLKRLLAASNGEG